MSRACREWRGDIGACIVGALGEDERAPLARHLAVCSGCRADYDELAEVRTWLSKLTFYGSNGAFPLVGDKPGDGKR